MTHENKFPMVSVTVPTTDAAQTRTPDRTTSDDGRLLVDGQNTRLFNTRPALPIKDAATLPIAFGPTTDDAYKLCDAADRRDDAKKAAAVRDYLRDYGQKFGPDYNADNMTPNTHEYRVRPNGYYDIMGTNDNALYSDGWHYMPVCKDGQTRPDYKPEHQTRPERDYQTGTRNYCGFSGMVLKCIVSAQIDRRLASSFLKSLKSRGNDDARQIFFTQWRDDMTTSISFDDILQQCRLGILLAVRDGLLCGVWSDVITRELVLDIADNVAFYKTVYHEMSSYLYEHKTKQTRHQYVMAADETLVDIADRKTWAALSDIDGLLSGQTVKTFFEYIRQARPNDARKYIDTAIALMSSQTDKQIADNLGISTSTVLARQTVLHRLYMACFADTARQTERPIWYNGRTPEHARQAQTAQTVGNWDVFGQTARRAEYKTTFTRAELQAMSR